MKFFIYSRKSVYTGKGESIENQIEMCKQYIANKFPGPSDADIAVYEDEGFSAKNTDRPQFQKMLADMKTQKPDYVVCYRLDRISRSVSDFSTLIEDLNDRSISFLCIKEEFDTSKPMGKAMMYIASVFAQLERETIAERVRDNMLMLARTGRWLGGTTPTGYTSEKVQELIIDGKVKTACKLVENPEEMRAVRMIFEKYLELRSVSGVSKYLIKEGIKSRSGEIYSLLGIKDILQNPVYCTADREALDYFTALGADVCFDGKDFAGKHGLIAYNKRDYTKKHAPRQAADKWIVAVGKHGGCVSGERWVLVQRILAANVPTGEKPAKQHNDYALLSGLIYCEKCGHRMFAKRRSGKNADKDTFDYVCESKLRGGTALCDCRNLNGPLADDRVCEQLCAYANPASPVYQMLENLKAEMATGQTKSPLDVLDARIKRCESEMDNLVGTLAQKNLGEAFVQRVNAKVTALNTEITALQAERAQLEKEAAVQNDKELQLDLIRSMLQSLTDNFEALSVSDRRTLVRLLISKLVWDGKDLHIFRYGE